MYEKRRWTLVTAMSLVALVSATVVEASDEQLGSESELAQLETQLTEITAERDALAQEAEIAAARYGRSAVTQQLIFEIIAEPTAFGTEDEVLDLLDSLAIPGMPYGDDAFGTVAWRAGWQGTLFGDVDATIHTWRSWLSDDGSMGGSMWTWSGTAQNGEPFALQGINLDTYDENGLMDSITVYYPYEDAEVTRRFYWGGGADE